MERFQKILLCVLSLFVNSTYSCLLSGSGGSCLMSGLSFGGRISLPENVLTLLAGDSHCPSARKRILIFQRPRKFRKGKSARSMFGHSGIGRIWMSKGSTCRDPTEEASLHCPVPENQARPCLDNSVPCHLDLTPPSYPVVKFEPSGTTKIELPPELTEGSTGYKIEYKKVNDTEWNSHEYSDTDPHDFTDFEEGYTYEVKITLKCNNSYDGNSEILEIFTMPCRDIDVDLTLSTSSLRHGLASITADWSYRDLTGPCAVTNQTISVKQLDLDNCTVPSDPLDKFDILNYDQMTYRLTKQRPNTEYNVSLTVYAHGKVYLTSKLFRTRQTAPSAAPTGISASSNKRAGRLSIRWNRLPCGKRNGQVQSYIVKMKRNRGVNVHNFRGTKATYTEFGAGEEYSIQVAAINSYGTGPYSPELTGRFTESSREESK